MDPPRKPPAKRQTEPSSTTSLGKRRKLTKKSKSNRARQSPQQGRSSSATSEQGAAYSPSSPIPESMQADYGSQASPMRTQPSGAADPPVKVAILGAAGGIGQSLALLLKVHSEYVQHLALYDLVHVRGVAADLAHVDRQCKVSAHLGPEELPEAVRGAKVIIVPAGLAQKPGMSRDDLFGSNAKIMLNLARVCAQVAPEAHLAIITNPVNSLVPLACEVYHHTIMGSKMNKSEGKHPPHDSCRRIYGVTTLDVVRSSTLTAQSAFFKPEAHGLFRDPAKISVPVVGGHAGKTIIPLLSQAAPKLDKKKLDDKTITMPLIESIQQAGIDVLNAKKGNGSATLAMAYAACRFVISLLRAQLGEQNIVECAYVRLQQPLVGDLDYFATPLVLGKDGYTKSLGFGANKLLSFEQLMIEEGAKELRTSIAKGEDFAKEHLATTNTIISKQ